jgi:hypothetical protein
VDLSFDYLKRFDFESILKFATVGLLKQKELKKEILKISLVLIIMLFLLGFFLGSSILSSYFLVINDLVLAFVLFGVSIILFLSILLAGSYFTYIIYSFALKSLGRKSINFHLNLGVKLFFCGVYGFLIAFFCLYELKLLLIGVLGFILLFLGIVLTLTNLGNSLLIGVGFIFIIIALILLLSYYIIIIRNSIRLLFSGIFLLEKDLSVKEALKKSWIISAGKVAPIFLIQLIIGGIVWVMQQIITVFLQVFLVSIGFGAGLDFLVVLLIIGLVISVLIFILMIVFSELVIVFAQTKIYVQIQSKNK